MTRQPRTSRAHARIAVLGAGATGGALAAELVRAGHRVCVWSRSPRRAAALAREVGAASSASLTGAVEGATIVVLCIRDAGLDELARRLAGSARPRGKPVVLHTSGARGREVLAPLERAGWSTAALHPLTALTRGRAKDGIRACGWALECEAARARAAARTLVRACSGTLFSISSRAGERVDYHLAATLLSNGALALWDIVLGDLLPRGLRRPEVRRAMSQLLAHTTENLTRARSSGEVQTGPVARGDAATIRAHLARLPLSRRDGGRLGSRAEARELYRLLGARLVRIARASGRLDARRAREIDRLLGTARARR